MTCKNIMAPSYDELYDDIRNSSSVYLGSFVKLIKPTLSHTVAVVSALAREKKGRLLVERGTVGAYLRRGRNTLEGGRSGRGMSPCHARRF